MAQTKTNPLREEVAEKDTWNLEPLFHSDEAWETAYHALQEKIEGFEQFRGHLKDSAQILRECFDFQTEFEKEAERLGSYAFLRSSEDVANNKYQGLVARYMRLATQASEAASFTAPEIQAIPIKTMRKFLNAPELEPYRFALEKLLRYKPHILSRAEERILAMQGEIADTAHKAFSQLTDADLDFGSVKDEKGHSVELTQGSFRTLLESPKRSVRRQAFKKFYEGFESHANTLAATLSSSVLQDIYQARVRNHPSALEAALFSDNVPVTVYNNLIDTIHANLETVYRYLEIRRKALKVRDLHFYDNYVPIVDLKRTKTTYEDAVEMVIEGLRPLGSNYCRTLKRGLLGRWVDRYENKGKRSGAFSGGGFTGPPYILLNYKENVLDSVFTLAHEAGHSMHTYYSAKAQPFQYYDYTIFAAEVASTFNEQLLNHYLLEQAGDKKTRAYLISRAIDEIRGTLVRQSMFAEFEKNIHAAAENNEPLTLERLRYEYNRLLELYFGPNFTLDEALTLEGLRIPHFYRAFYVYKYATGLSAAIALSQMVLSGGADERNRYLSFLKMGGSMYPLDELREAGVDMERPEPIEQAMRHFRALVDELEELL